MTVDLIDLPVARAVAVAIGWQAARDILMRCVADGGLYRETSTCLYAITGSKPEIVERDGVGVLTSIMHLGSDCYWEDGSITMPTRRFPETLAVTMPGKPVSDVVGDHHLFRGLTVARMSVDDAGTVVDVADAGRTLDRIMASLRT